MPRPSRTRRRRGLRENLPSVVLALRRGEPIEYSAEAADELLDFAFFDNATADEEDKIFELLDAWDAARGIKRDDD